MASSTGTRAKRKRPLSRQLLYAAIPTILAFLVVEGLFRLYFAVTAKPSLWAVETISQNPALTSKPWFTREFLDSSLARRDHFSPVGTRLVFPMDFQDRYCSVRDGVRTTVGFDPGGLPAGRRPRKLFLLGGSTTYSADTPDDLTYASQLQARLAAIPETRDIQVFNYGVTSAVSLQEVGRLEYEIKRNNIPDLCIFYDGINDVFQGIVNGDPTGTIFEAETNHGNGGLLITLKRIARLSVAAQTIYGSIMNSQRRNNPTHTRSEAKVRDLAEATAENYERNMLRAKEICDRHHIRMMVFLQPHLFSISGRPWTPHEQEIARWIRTAHADAFRVCYPLLRAKLDVLRQRGIPAYDISDAFNENIEPIFLDESHVESTGNRLIVDAMLKHARLLLKDSSSQAMVPSVALDRQAGR
jgi:lysophospholipase L1-like esterase